MEAWHIWSILDFNRREWGVLVPLSMAGFFEVYDVALLTLAAPHIASGLGVGIASFGIGVALIRLATLGSLPLLRLADRWGRRPMLIASLAIFTLATGATALAWGFVAFIALQALARVFLATESGLASLVIAEELRPDRRGTGLCTLGLMVLGGLANVVSPSLLLLILGGCLAPAVLALRGLPETARRDLVAESPRPELPLPLATGPATGIGW